MLKLAGNVALRGLTIASRFALVLYVAAAYEPGVLGKFNLLQVTVFGATLISAFEMQHITYRDALAAESHEQFLRAHLRIVAVATLIAAGLLTAVMSKYLNGAALLLLIAVFATEAVLNQVHHRLVALSRSDAAYLVMFLRQAAWVPVFIGFSVLLPSADPVVLLLIVWFVVLVGTVAVSAAILRGDALLEWRALLRSGGRLSPAGRARQAVPLVAAVAVLFLVDHAVKYAIAFIGSLRDVGVYTFFAGFVMAIESLVVAAVIHPRYAAMISAASRPPEQRSSEYLRAVLMAGAVFVVFFAAIAIVVPIVVALLQDRPYRDFVGLLFLLALAGFASVQSQLLNYQLVASRLEGRLLMSNISALAILVIGLAIVASDYGLFNVAVVVVISAWTQMILKFLAGRRSILSHAAS